MKAHAARLDFEGDNFLVQPVSGTLCVNGKGAVSATQQDAENGMLVPMARSVALRGREGGATAELGDDLANCLRASGGGGDKAHVLAPIAFTCKDYGADAITELAPTMRAMGHASSHADAGGQLAVCFAENSRGELRLEGGDGQRTGCLSTGGGKPGQGTPMVAVTYPIQNALRGAGQNGLGIGDPADPMYTLDLGSQHAVCVTGEITHTLKAEGFDASEDGTGRGQPITIAMRESGPGYWMQDEIAGTLRAEGENRPSRPSNVIAQAFQQSQSGVRLGDTVGTLRSSTAGGLHDHGVLTSMAVRRLTPRECERLQGFPDDYTLIPHRGKPAADGPRYKALGNSWAVPKFAWLGERIDAALTLERGLDLRNAVRRA